MEERQRIQRRGVAIALAALIGAGGCNQQDQLVRQMASEAMAEQGEQNRAMAALNRDVAFATRRIAEEQAKTRQAYVDAQEQLQKQRIELDQRLEGLDEERRQIARERHRDPIIAAAIFQLGLIVACLSPLVLCWALLHGDRSDSSETELNELLVEDLVAEHPRLLPRPQEQPKELPEHRKPEDPPYRDELDDRFARSR